MRWNEIFTEDLSVVQIAKSYIMDIISTLKAQGVDSITVKQVVDQLGQDPDLKGIGIDQGLINQALKGVPNVQITPSAETGEMSIVIDDPTAGRQVDAKQAEKDDNTIHSAAMRTIDKGDDSI